MLDIVIQDCLIVDGTGAPRFRADVAVQGERIAGIGRFDTAQVKQSINASGLVCAPGFIDMHSHADLTLPVCPTADSMIHQGITSAVVGQCGISAAPLLDDTRKTVTTAWDITGVPLPWDEWSTLASYLGFLMRTGISINVVPLAGQGTIRAGLMGFSPEPASADQIDSMHHLLNKTMDEGAVGVSTGLDYPPGSYASVDELIQFTRPVGLRNGYYFSHIRGEGGTLLEAVGEALRIGRETGSSVQIAHFKAAGRDNWRLAPKGLELINRARREGLDVTADVYTYTAGSTGLRALLPQWAQEGGQEATLARLLDRHTRRKMAAEMRTRGFASTVEFDRVHICSSPKQPAFEGRIIRELADEAGKTPYEWVFDALVETEMNAMIAAYLQSEENVALALRHPAVMIGTDGFGLPFKGPLARGKPHPRCFGTYPRLLGHYVREKNVLTLEEAVWKSSGFPAQKLGWSDRGVIKEGYKADLVVFDPDTILDRATFEEPHQYPTGVFHVLVNGVLVILRGQHTQSRPGVVLGA